MTESARVTDKALHYYARFDEKLRERLRALITDELIAEHKENPLGFRGHHSPDLQFVLNYFRRSPQAGKYIIVASVPWQEYRIGVLSGVRGVAPEVLEEPVFATEEEAIHGTFLARVRDLMDDGR
jgi:branched-chain amino acid transport system permease protein